jgi:hypothetical protein
MGEPSLTEIQKQQADQLSNAYLTGVENEKDTRLHDLDQLYSAAHGGLVGCLNLLDQETVEKWSKSGKSIYQLDDRFILGRVTELIKALREKAASVGQPNDGVAEELRKQLATANQQIAVLGAEVDRYKRKLADLEHENENLQTQLAALREVQKKVDQKAAENSQVPSLSVPAPLERGMSEPDWMTTWRKKGTFDRDSKILCLIGGKGISRRPEIIELAAQELELNPKNTAIGDAIMRLAGDDPDKGLHFIEKIAGFEKQGADFGGALPDMYRITERGRQAYWMITGQNAVPCEYDRLLRRHKSPEHTYLNILVRELLEKVGGYRVLLEAAEITLPGGEKFEPDITAHHLETGEVIFVEVERDTNKDEAYRIQKWKHLYSASNGQIYVFCDKNKFMKGKIISEVNQALSGLKFSSHFSSVEGIRNGERGENGSIWLRGR